MVSRYYRDRLQAVLATADDASISEVSRNWEVRAQSVDDLANGLRTHGRTIDSEIEGEAGRAMVANFTEISERLEAAAADMRKGSVALGAAESAARQALTARNGLQLSGPMNQPPVRPEGPLPGQQPTPAQETAMGRYNAGMAAYLQNEQMYEDQARRALQALDREYAAQAEVMKEIHGEPDPVDTPSTPTSGGAGGGGVPATVPAPPPGTPGASEPRGPREPVFVQVHQPETEVVEVRDPDDVTTTTTNATTHPPHTQPHVAPHVPGTSVAGGTDGGFEYAPPTSTTGAGGPGAPAPAGSGTGSGTASGAGIAAGGLAGGAAGAAGVRGSAPAAPLRSAGVKGIGATARPSAPGSLSRTAGPGSTGARAASSTTRGTSVGGARGVGSSPAAGSTARGGSVGGSRGTGSATGATGGARTGAAAGARGGRKADERTEQRDALVYEQDWLGDESPGTGVLD